MRSCEEAEMEGRKLFPCPNGLALCGTPKVGAIKGRPNCTPQSRADEGFGGPLPSPALWSLSGEKKGRCVSPKDRNESERFYFIIQPRVFPACSSNSYRHLTPRAQPGHDVPRPQTSLRAGGPSGLQGTNPHPLGRQAGSAQSTT